MKNLHPQAPQRGKTGKKVNGGIGASEIEGNQKKLRTGPNRLAIVKGEFPKMCIKIYLI